MKIIHVLAYYGDYLGGIQTYVQELAKRQKTEGHDVKIITSNIKGSQNEIDGIPIIRAKAWFSAFRTPFIPSLPLKLLKEKCDVVHAHLPSPGLDLSVSFKKLLSPKTNLVLTIHNDLQINSILSKIFGFLHNRLLIQIPKILSNSIITTTKEFPKSLPYKINAKKHSVIPIGIDTELFKPKGKVNPNQILFVGRMIPEKGLHILVNTIKKINASGSNLKLIAVCSDTYDYDDYENNIKEEGKGFLKILKNKLPKELSKHYSSSIMTVLSSLQESFGIVILESLACGTPVVAFNTPGPVSILNDSSGILVECGDGKKLKNAIEKMISKNKMYRKNCRKYTQDNFNWKDIDKQILKVYKNEKH